MNSVEKIASSNGSTFFITNNNDVFVIGHNNYGECGTGNRESVRDISKIEEIPKAIDIKVRISRSFLLSKDFDVYSCGMNFKDSLLNEIFVFGKNTRGILGINSNEKEIRLPRKINGFKNIKNVYCSNDNMESAFFLTKLGNIYISGDYNYFEELSINTEMKSKCLWKINLKDICV